jgi:hypothetical protein
MKCIVVGSYWHFGRKCCIPFFRIEVIQAGDIPEIFITSNHTTNYHNPDDHSPDLYGCLYYSGLMLRGNQSTVRKAGVFSEQGNGYLDKEYIIIKANVKH